MSEARNKAIKGRRPATVLLVLLVSAFIGWIAEVVINSDKPEFSKTIKQKFLEENSSWQIIQGQARVIDGDSLKINQENIRLLYIDAPEFQQKCLDQNYYEYECGRISYNFLKNLVKNQKLLCKYRERDIYKRILAICYLGKININYEMLSKGQAIIYDIAKASPELKEIETRAQANKLGVWQGPFLEPKEYRRLNKKHLRKSKK